MHARSNPLILFNHDWTVAKYLEHRWIDALGVVAARPFFGKKRIAKYHNSYSIDSIFTFFNEKPSHLNCVLGNGYKIVHSSFYL